MTASELAQEVYRIASCLELYSIKITTTQKCMLPDFKFSDMHEVLIEWGIFGQNKIRYEFYDTGFYHMKAFQDMVERIATDPMADEINRLMKA